MANLSRMIRKVGPNLKLLAASSAPGSGRSARLLLRCSSTKPQSKLKVHLLPRQIIANTEDYKSSILRRGMLPHPDLDIFPLIYEKTRHLEERRKTLVELRSVLQRNHKRADELVKQHNVPSLREIKQEVKSLEAQLAIYEARLQDVAESLPNLLDSLVDDSEIQLVEYLNEQPAVKDASKAHKEICEKLGLADFKTAAQVSGSLWYYLTGYGAMLEQALVQYALSEARKAGYKMCTPPLIVRSEISDACGFRPKDQNNEQQTYEIDGGRLVLTGTAEIPLAGLLLNKTYKENELPLRLVGPSRSYRAEAGARGRDTKGLYRVHEFTKVELFVTCDQQSLESEFLRLVGLQKKIIQQLGLYARVINIPANDLGAPAFKKYDIEAWMPGREAWGELTLTSICTDFQARRFGTKYVDRATNKAVFAHTLNGTAMAVPRVIVALIENGYEEVAGRGRVKIPQVLRKWMDELEYIE